MENLIKIKVLLLKQLMELLDQKINTLKLDMASIKDTRDSDTRSSAGDKFETNRVLIQMELDKTEVQLNKTKVLRNELSHIDIQKQYTQVEFGSLVCTTQGNYFFSVALGKFEVNKEIYHCISLGSPIGQSLQNKKVNDTILFQGNAVTIVSIV